MIWYDWQEEKWFDDNDPTWSCDMTPENCEVLHKTFNTQQEFNDFFGE